MKSCSTKPYKHQVRMIHQMCVRKRRMFLMATVILIAVSKLTAFAYFSKMFCHAQPLHPKMNAGREG